MDASSSGSSPSLAALPTGASWVDEFEPVQRAHWQAKVDANAPGAAARLDRVTEDGVRVAALYTAADAPRPAPREVPAATFVGRLHEGGNAHTLSATVQADAARGVQTSWVRLPPAQRSGCAVTAGGPGVAVDVEIVGALARTGASVVLEAGASASALLRALPAEHAIMGVLACPVATLAETGALGRTLEDATAQCVADTRWALEHQPAVATVLLSSLPFHDAGATDVQELGIVVAQGLALLAACARAGLPACDVARRIVLQIAVEHAPFAAIAKLRAARLLWSSVLSHCGAPDVVPNIWVRSSVRMRTQHDVANNLLRATLEAFAAAAGGANGALVLPHTVALGDPDDDATRLAVNAQLLLRDESGLGRVADPGAGSWAVEARTQALAREAWAHTQAIDARGGVGAALLDGSLPREISEAARQRDSAVAHRRVPITGVTIFPDATKVPLRAPDRAPDAGASAAGEAVVTVAPLVPRRLAAPVERLRAAAEDAPEPPRVALVRLADEAMVRPQLEFAAEALAAGGIATQRVGPTLADIDFARFGGVVLCGSAADIVAHGVAAAHAAQTANVQRILVAGRPGDNESRLAAAGVDGYLHRGVDVVALLRDVQRALDIGGGQ